MKQVRLELKGSWVLAHRGDSVKPVDLFVNVIREKIGGEIKVSKHSFTECELLLVDSDLSLEEIDAIVVSVLANELRLEKDSEAVNYTVADLGETPTPEREEKDAEDKIIKREEKNKEAKGSENAGDRKAKNGGDINLSDLLHPAKNASSADEERAVPPDERIDSLIGADEFKGFLKELQMIAPQVLKHKTAKAFSFQNYLFSINQGCGLTTSLQLLADVLSGCKLFQFSGENPVIEEKLLPPGPDSFNSVLSLFNGYGKGVGKLICIDISEWMSHLADKRMRDFLSRIEELSTNTIFVFRIPFVEPETLYDISASLSDILFIRPISFTPMSMEELLLCGKNALDKYHYSADEAAWKLFERRLIEEKSDGRFYGIDTVNKVINEMIYRKQLFDARNDTDSDVIKSEEIADLVKTDKDEGEGLSALKKMVGMEDILRNVDEIITQIELAKANKDLGNPCLHMRFIGNPGTGKTTVARLVGQILKERGVLRNGNFFEYSGRDLCGRYVGETAPKTASMCRDAYGSVMFIDEAYSLYRGDNNNADYGKEALDTLIAEMENHRDDFVVIMAGYPDEMEELMRGNIGLESRMPYELFFPNYTREQLYQIFMSMAENSVAFDETLSETAKAYFDSLPEDFISSEKFSNARFVRNLFERTCAKAAVRARLNGSGAIVLTKEDFTLAVSDRSFDKLLEKKKKNRIGFVS